MEGEIMAKSIQKGIEKTMKKGKASRWTKRRFEVGFQALGGRGKPFPKGIMVGKKSVGNKYSTLNHLSPKGWWDF